MAQTRSPSRQNDTFKLAVLANRAPSTPQSITMEELYRLWQDDQSALRSERSSHDYTKAHASCTEDKVSLEAALELVSSSFSDLGKLRNCKLSLRVEHHHHSTAHQRNKMKMADDETTIVGYQVEGVHHEATITELRQLVSQKPQ